MQTELCRSLALRWSIVFVGLSLMLGGCTDHISRLPRTVYVRKAKIEVSAYSKESGHSIRRKAIT